MKPYALGIDCRLAASTGIGRYLREIAPRVAERFGAARLLLIGRPGELEWARALTQAGAGTMFSEAPVFRGREQWLGREAGRRCDLLWCPHFNVPWFPTSRLAVTVHDLIPLHVAVGWKGHVRRLGAAAFLAAVRRRAGLVLTVSRQVKGELEAELGLPPERIRAIPNGVDAVWFEATAPRPPGPPYVIYVGNVSPHKNVEGLMEAFAAVQARVPHQLVIVGEERGFTSQGVLRGWREKLGPRARVLSRLSDAELRAWVAGADLLVQPSLEEGFGLPPLEAMAAGCPVLTSDCAALRETAAEGAHRFRLGVRGDCARALGELLANEALRRSKVDEGRRWARRFTWEETGRGVARELHAAWEAGR